MAYGEIQLTRSNYAIDDEKSGRHFTKYKSVDGTIVGNGDKLFDIPYFFINPRVGINYSIDTDNKLYAFAAITNREPRMRNLYPADDSYFGAQPLFKGQFLMTGEAAYDFTKPIAKPESMLDIEAGWNYRYKNLFLNLNLYWMDYSNELVKSGQLDIFGNPVEGNAEKTRHYGFELSAGINELNTDFGKFGFSGNFTLSRNKIIKYDWLIGVDSLGNKLILPLAGNDISGFPDMMGNFSMHYNWNNLYLNVLFHVVGSYRTDNFGEMITTEPLLRNYLGYGYYSDNTLDSYSFLNANLSYSIYGFCSVRELKLRFQANNILNSLYNAGAEGKDFFPAAERNFYLGVEIGL
jgi:iron complex outermembrane receptor protein